jgi:aryl-alcohol dehydrogenase-like predicted oxidoreductase
MDNRRLGTGGPQVSALGLGCMGMSEFYGTGDTQESIAVLNRALEVGCTFWDTADVYGVGLNEVLLSRVLRERRKDVFLCTKFGNVRGMDGSWNGINGRPDYVKKACDASLMRLGVDMIDLYYQHRVDDQVPIEETVGAMAELVKAGKVRYLGLSEAGPKTIRRAHAVHPIAAGQYEYSFWTRDIEEHVIPTLRELGIALVAYSPLGRGFLTGKYKTPEQYSAIGDARGNFPRFQGENLELNRKWLERIEARAATHGCTPAQLAIAWVMAKGNEVIPIPGTKRRERFDENVGSLRVQLTPDDITELDAMTESHHIAGTRYHEQGMKIVLRESI